MILHQSQKNIDFQQITYVTIKTTSILSRVNDVSFEPLNLAINFFSVLENLEITTLAGTFPGKDLSIGEIPSWLPFWTGWNSLADSSMMHHSENCENYFLYYHSQLPSDQESITKTQSEFRPRMFRKLFQHHRETPCATMARHPATMTRNPRRLSEQVSRVVHSHSTTEVEKHPRRGSENYYVNARGQVSGSYL